MTDTDNTSTEIADGLASQHDYMRAEALAKLCCLPRFDASLKPSVSACLQDSNPTVRELAVVVLGRAGGACLEPLITALDDTQSVSTRILAASGISKVGDYGQAATAQLCKCLESADELLRWHAAFALSKIGKEAISPLRNMLITVDASMLPGVVTALGWIGAEASAAIETIQSLASSSPITLRLACSSALIRISGDTTAGLAMAMKSLDDQDAGNRVATLNSLAELGPLANQAAEKIVVALTDPSAEVRSAAALALARIDAREPQMVKGLVALLEDENAKVRGDAGIALSKFGSAAAIALPSLEKMQGDTDSRLATIGKAAADIISMAAG